MSILSPARGCSLEIAQLGRKFGSHQVLKDISLSISAGEFVAIVGRSGCGKSTLLRLIAGVDTPDAGQIRIDGKIPGPRRPYLKFVFQEARLLPWKKVWQNIALFAENRSRAAALDTLRDVGLADRADDYPAMLSGGQKQRVALARALASSPGLLLLDEPLGALDALTRLEMQVLIERLWQEKGFTVILVTHDVAEAVYLADRVILIEEGEAAMDTPITLARPHERDSSFAYFEQKILNRVMHHEDKRRADYAI